MIVKVNLNLYFLISNVKYVCYLYRKLRFLDSRCIYILKILDNFFFIWLYMISIFNALKSLHKNFSLCKKGLNLLVENLILKLCVEIFYYIFCFRYM